MFRFANPHFLWLLAAVPALVALGWLSLRLRRRRMARFAAPALLGDLAPETAPGRLRLKFLLFVGAVGLLALAAARPQAGSKLREQKAEGVELMLVVDVSNSMLAEDFEPSRLERTKYAIDRLVEGLGQERIGLVVFAGEPRVQLPVTSDYRMARAFARRIDPSLVSVQGTAVGRALSQALLSFSEASDDNKRSRAIVLITDGENHEDDALAAAARAAEGFVGGRGDDVGILQRIVEQTGGDKAGGMSHVDHEDGTDFIGQTAHAGIVPFAAVGAGTTDDELRTLAACYLLHLFVVDEAGIFLNVVLKRLEHKAGEVDGASMGKVTAMGEIESEELVAGLHAGHEYGHVGLCSGVWLHVGIFSAEYALDAVDGNAFGLVYHLASAIVAVAGIALGIFVGKA